MLYIAKKKTEIQIFSTKTENDNNRAYRWKL